MVNRLAFVPGESPAHRLHFWEPVVDGRPLRQLLTEAAGEESLDWMVGDNVSVIVHSWRTGMSDDAFVLLGDKPPELANGRVAIWVCPVCGDLGCGAVTAALEWTAETVVWRDFGWDVNYDTDETDERALFAGPFVFDRAQYESELRRFVDTFDEVRGSLPAHLLPPVEGEDERKRRRHWWWPFR
jgi:hypothetical protein